MLTHMGHAAVRATDFETAATGGHVIRHRADLWLRSPTLLWATLSLTAGSADVISFLALGGLFNAHVTGNLIVLMVRIVNGGTTPLALLLSVPVFAAVVFLVRLLVARLDRAHLPSLLPLLLLQLVLLVGCLVVSVAGRPVLESSPAQVVAGMLGVAAMAVQNMFVQSMLDGAPPTAAMTANVTRFALALAELVLGRGARERAAARSQVAHSWPALAGFACGAGLGAALEAGLGVWAFGLPVGTALLALVLALPRTSGGAPDEWHSCTGSNGPRS